MWGNLRCLAKKSLEVRIPSQEHGRYTLVEQVCSSFIPSPNSVFVPDFCLIPIRGNKNCHLSFLSSFLAPSCFLWEFPTGITHASSFPSLPPPPQCVKSSSYISSISAVRTSLPICRIKKVWEREKQTWIFGESSWSNLPLTVRHWPSTIVHRKG